MQLIQYTSKGQDGAKMRKAEEMLEELNKMEFWVEDDNCVTDSDPIEYVLECLLKGKEITVGVHKDFRNR